MVILHFASIENNLFSGVCVVVPQYLLWQEKLGNEVALINVKGVRIERIDCQIPYRGPFNIDDLPSPFNSPDIVIFQECYRKEYLQIGHQLRKKKIPYIIIPHGELGRGAQEKKKIKKMVANATVFRRFINGAQAIQCLSEKEYDETLFGKQKFVATNGVLISNNKKKQFSDTGVRYVYIGRLDAFHKGLDLLVEAVSKIADYLRRMECTFDIYGPDKEGRAEHLYSMIKETGIEDLITLKGAVTGIEKEDVLLNADVFIQTSRFEGMPLGILEAMSYGIPCLVTEGTNLAHEIKDNNCGWACETTSNGISQILLQACDEKDKWMQKGLNGRNYVRKEFSWDEITKKTLNNYKSVIKKTKKDVKN